MGFKYIRKTGGSAQLHAAETIAKSLDIGAAEKPSFVLMTRGMKFVCKSDLGVEVFEERLDESLLGDEILGGRQLLTRCLTDRA